MGKFITPQHNDIDAAAVYLKVVAAAKKITRHVYDESLSLSGSPNKFVISIATNEPESVGDAAHDIIKKSQRAIWVGQTVYAGNFDWASQTYNKDCVLIYFKY